MISIEEIIGELDQTCVGYDSLQEFHDAIDMLTEWGLSEILHRLNLNKIFVSDEHIFDVADLMQYLNALPKHRRYLDSVLEVLVRRGYLQNLAEGIYEYNSSILLKTEGVRNSFSYIIEKCPAVKDNALFFKRVINNLFESLKGEKNFLNILFPSGSFEVVERLYKLSPDAAYFNQLAANVVDCYSRRHCERHAGKISYLEIGAGVGSTTERVLPLINKSNCCFEYRYTDISRSFLLNAQNTFGQEYDFLSFSPLDISQQNDVIAIDKQYDFVIATNVLHATPNMLKTLAHVRSLLKPNGILILNEGVKKIDFSTLIYGLTDGWWLFEDPEWRIPGSPFVDLATWRKLLLMSGFGKFSSMNDLIKPKMSIFQDVMVVQ